ncbi:MAG: hypothetical protein NVV63_15810 [Opitutus sp.]|nr:hypothetical protein [Opitutus sp.]
MRRAANSESRPAPGDKVVVKLHPWKHRRDALTGELVSRLGRTHEPQAELLGIFEKIQSRDQVPRRGRARGGRHSRSRATA